MRTLGRQSWIEQSSFTPDSGTTKPPTPVNKLEPVSIGIYGFNLCPQLELYYLLVSRLLEIFMVFILVLWLLVLVLILYPLALVLILYGLWNSIWVSQSHMLVRIFFCRSWSWSWLFSLGLHSSGLGLGFGLSSSSLGFGLGLSTAGLDYKSEIAQTDESSAQHRRMWNSQRGITCIYFGLCIRKTGEERKLVFSYKDRHWYQTLEQYTNTYTNKLHTKQMVASTWLVYLQERLSAPGKWLSNDDVRKVNKGIWYWIVFTLL